MTRFYCTMQRQRFDNMMRQRTPLLTLNNIATRPQPGDELEITVVNPDRTTKTTITDILNRRPGNEHKSWIVSVRTRRSPEESEPCTPAGKIMQKYHEEQAHKHNAALARMLNVVNRKAALAEMVFSPQRNSFARPTQHRRTSQ
ncbi:hypothetical protein AWD60_001518 [Escherichia coli]|uniref:hypothetical protein n=1 Tax=Escherichia coli TaxID=562 RepID=UPI000BDE73D5|nr:hypothetical protein [Escherichia coli]EFA6280573.1 hypothetical protein [Escherichia coli]EFC6773067.1 hypothetical protein [Escherichia coli]EFD5022653.1 hypothetical protein [Escherichia coli]EFD5036062.1 hypothetical protein [Escherichia coli]EFE6088907.1 hypothetical protein [Escherichia coli]